VRPPILSPCSQGPFYTSFYGFCTAILLTISTILGCRKVIHCEGMSFTGSVRVHISACADFRLWPTSADLGEGVSRQLSEVYRS